MAKAKWANANLAPAQHPGDCVSYRLRRAARVAAKAYDAALKPAGIRNTQFTALAALASEGPMSIGDLAALLATDATTLTRNLDVLVRRGFIENIAGEDGRVREVHLSEAGSAKFDQALPRWRQAQKQVLASLGQLAWTDVERRLLKIEKACNAIG